MNEEIKAAEPEEEKETAEMAKTAGMAQTAEMTEKAVKHAEAPLLSVSDLHVGFETDHKKMLHAVDGVSFQVYPGETLGIVGESGCGKSISCMSVLKLIQGENVRYESGRIDYKGKNTLAMTEKELQKLRGREISMIFQEPMTALNPLYSIGDQMEESLKLHTKLSKHERHKRCAEMLEKVRIPKPEEVMLRYPFNLSGGMRQRVMIAMAIINKPALLIADEPTTALDVTIQAQILDIMKSLKTEAGGLLMITHNLGIVAEICEEVVVMYAGRAIERGTLAAIFDHPLHPYTKGLMASVPSLKSDKKPLYTIPGTVPTVYDFTAGCRFADRCPYCTEQCKKETPPQKCVGKDHIVSCWLEFEGEEAS